MKPSALSTCPLSPQPSGKTAIFQSPTTFVPASGLPPAVAPSTWEVLSRRCPGSGPPGSRTLSNPLICSGVPLAPRARSSAPCSAIISLPELVTRVRLCPCLLSLTHQPVNPRRMGSVSILFPAVSSGPRWSPAQLVPREHVCWQWTELVRDTISYCVCRAGSCVPTRQFPSSSLTSAGRRAASPARHPEA